MNINATVLDQPTQDIKQVNININTTVIDQPAHGTQNKSKLSRYVKWLLKNSQTTKILTTKGSIAECIQLSLNAGQNYCRTHSAIFLTALSDNWSWRPILVYFSMTVLHRFYYTVCKETNQPSLSQWLIVNIEKAQPHKTKIKHERRTMGANWNLIFIMVIKSQNKLLIINIEKKTSGVDQDFTVHL